MSKEKEEFAFNPIGYICVDPNTDLFIDLDVCVGTQVKEDGGACRIQFFMFGGFTLLSERIDEADVADYQTRMWNAWMEYGEDL